MIMLEANRKAVSIQNEALPQGWGSDYHLFLLETFWVKKNGGFTKHADRGLLPVL